LFHYSKFFEQKWLASSRIKVQYRAEFFNIFNLLQWFGVNSGIGNVANPDSRVTIPGTFGQLVSTRNSGKNQLALKFVF
jgi:hypothetical protein